MSVRWRWCHASRMRPGTPPKKIPEIKTLVSTTTRISGRTVVSLPSTRLPDGGGEVAASHARAFSYSARPLHERGVIASRRRLQDFEDHHVLVPDHDKLRTGPEPESLPDPPRESRPGPSTIV